MTEVDKQVDEQVEKLKDALKKLRAENALLHLEVGRWVAEADKYDAKLEAARVEVQGIEELRVKSATEALHWYNAYAKARDTLRATEDLLHSISVQREIAQNMNHTYAKEIAQLRAEKKAIAAMSCELVRSVKGEER